MNNKKYLINNKELMLEWNYELNNNLNIIPNNITIGSHKKVYWKCPICGNEWKNSIALRTKGFGKCKVCHKR